MGGAYWVEIRNDDRLLGYQSIRMRPRDLAKVGQVMLNDGMWNGARYLPAGYIDQLRTAPAPEANPSYGLFWHLNAGDYYLSYRESNFVRNRLLPGTPADAYANFGNGGQIIMVVPSLDLVWVRTGRQIPSNIWAPDSTVAQLSAALVASVVR
jgi:CubicO group peptidase (beta-lactamase class C family)